MQLVVGDLHLELSYDGYDRTDDIFEFLEKLYCENNDGNNGLPIVTRVVWLGDIFHTPNVSHRRISEFIKYLDRWRFVDHIILKGNHDGEPNSKKGSPLLEVEAAGSAKVIWEPTYIKNELFYPYYIGKEIEERPNTERIYTHMDIEGVVPGLEKEIGRGATSFLPEWCYKYPIMAGHIHKPQTVNNLTVVGSVIKCRIDEKDDVKNYYRMDESFGIQQVPIKTRNLYYINLNYDTVEGQEIYKRLIERKYETVFKDMIVSIDLLCPHNKAHLINQTEFEQSLRNQCKHLKYSFNILREKQKRMKELDSTKSDYEICSSWLENSNISDKADILELVNTEILAT